MNPVTGSAWDFVLRGDAVLMEQYPSDPVRAAQASRRLYDEALRIDPNFVPALAGASQIFFTEMQNNLEANSAKYRQQLEESDRLTARAVMIDPKDTTAWFARATILSALGRFNEAMAAIVRAKASIQPVRRMSRGTRRLRCCMRKLDEDSTEGYRQRVGTRVLSGLRKAGVPER
ncbi:MAG TPA: hypothetical protein VNG69_16330 [Casimicrobiaceae bacterium]|nr:hypothetical protein [Casimicrobiaceae bacterium]